MKEKVRKFIKISCSPEVSYLSFILRTDNDLIRPVTIKTYLVSIISDFE